MLDLIHPKKIASRNISEDIPSIGISTNFAKKKIKTSIRGDLLIPMDLTSIFLLIYCKGKFVVKKN